MGGVVCLSFSFFRMGCPALELAGPWVELNLSVEVEISGRALFDWYYVGPGGLSWSSVLNSALPPERLRPGTCPEHQDPVSHLEDHRLIIKWCNSQTAKWKTCRGQYGERAWSFHVICRRPTPSKSPRVHQPEAPISLFWFHLDWKLSGVIVLF